MKIFKIPFFSVGYRIWSPIDDGMQLDEFEFEFEFNEGRTFTLTFNIGFGTGALLKMAALGGSVRGIGGFVLSQAPSTSM